MRLAISHFEGTFYNNSITLAQPSNLHYSFPLLKSVEYYLDTIFFSLPVLHFCLSFNTTGAEAAKGSLGA